MTRETILLEALKKIANDLPTYTVSEDYVELKRIAQQAIAAYGKGGDGQNAIEFAEWIIHRDDWRDMRGNWDWTKTTAELYQLFTSKQEQK